ncbi:hypothetical protein AVEN_212220-1 [Araneus ventricosus]|uniref:Uncharacterized protein n=1 Tax=Araneus ventricosus TaxID=182803 RepID=A0A4Y2R6S2_ARAVE|nr:hypothetical protein AVEN_212220-1 [Araneus ventricosus]
MVNKAVDEINNQHRLLTNKIRNLLTPAKKTYLNRNIHNNSIIPSALFIPLRSSCLQPCPFSNLTWNIPCQRQIISFSVSGSIHMFTTILTCHQHHHHVKVHVIILGSRV